MPRERRIKRTLADDSDGFPTNFQIEFERSAGSGSIDQTTIKGKRYHRGRVWLTNELGVRQRKVVYGVSADEVEKKIRALLTSPGSNVKRLTVEQYLHRFLKEQKSEIRPSTWRLYDGTIRVHIIPHLGKAKFCLVDTNNVKALLRALEEKGVGSRTRQVVHKVLHRAYQVALGDEKLSKSLVRNPVAFVKAPIAQPKQQRILTHEEALKLLDAAEKTKWFALVYLLLVTGLRIGEAAGLTVETLHLDDANPYLYVYQGVADDEDGRPAVGVLKTAHAARRVDLDAESVRLLRAEAEGKKPADLVFSAGNGAPLNRRNFLRRDFARMLKEAELPAVTVHSLRHVANTLLLGSSSASLVDLSRRLGHGSPRITLEKYSHVIPGAQREIARKAGALFVRAEAEG